MKTHFENKITQLIMVLVLILGFVFMLITPAVAEETNSYQSGINGILHQPQENDFFKQGQEQFSREIQLLMRRSRSSQDEILKINPEVLLIQEILSPLEKPEPVITDINGHNTERTRLQKFE